MTGSPTIELTLHPLGQAELSSWREEWQALERRAENGSVYLAYEWLHAWTEAYRPRRLVLARGIRADDGCVAMLGLIEIDRVRGWRFAGGSITPCRGPLCVPGSEGAVWGALAERLRAHPRIWSSLEADEVDRSAEAIAGSQLSVRYGTRLSLPKSFDAYLASLPSKQRGTFRKRLRRAEEANAVVQAVPADQVPGAIEDFLDLHRRRAGAKRETHANIDESLGELLRGLADAQTIELSIFELRHEDRRVAVNVRLRYRDALFPYNLGWDPAVAHLAPGILLALNAIADGIERGAHALDLGPGDQEYKLALGCTRQTCLVLRADNPSTWGRGLRTLGTSLQRLRRSAHLREAVTSR